MRRLSSLPPPSLPRSKVPSSYCLPGCCPLPSNSMPSNNCQMSRRRGRCLPGETLFGSSRYEWIRPIISYTYLFERDQYSFIKAHNKLRVMDTRYWGPSGWRLLHLISFGTEANSKVCEFMNTLPYILPCKYCRKSLSEYMIKDPVECNTKNLPKWLWRIHNDVNEKLRDQRIHVEDDPSFALVETIYLERLASGCSRTSFEGWEFLFSIAEAHPLSRSARTSVPISGHPDIENLTEPLERNRWNVMSPEERLPYYNRFWELLPFVFPFPEWSESWVEVAPEFPKCRKDCLKYLWDIRQHMEEKLELLNRTSYNSLCRELRDNRSGCSTSTRAKTCRKTHRKNRVKAYTRSS